jgi:hypothetical protein
MLKSVYRFFSSKYKTLHADYAVDFVPRYGHGLPPHKELYAIINENRASYKSFIENALIHVSEIHSIKQSKDEQNTALPAWNNHFLPGLDIVALYAMLAHYQPKKYIEVGSGNSTKVAAFAKSKLNLATQITSIDPMPRAEIDALADEIIRKPFEAINLDSLLSLEENDILFIDNSHRILPNSDAMVFFMEILPRLKKGVIVHIHDIYLPYDYPQFMCDRFYTEQYGLAFYLLANPTKYRTIFPNYFISEDAELSALLQPFWAHPNLEGVERHGGSFWLQIQD